MRHVKTILSTVAVLACVTSQVHGQQTKPSTTTKLPSPTSPCLAALQKFKRHQLLTPSENDALQTCTQDELGGTIADPVEPTAELIPIQPPDWWKQLEALREYLSSPQQSSPQGT